MTEPAQQSGLEQSDVESLITKEELIKQLEISGVHLGDDPSGRIDTYVAAGLLPIPQLGRFPTWTVQRIIAIENKLAEGQSLEDIRKEVSEERRRFLSSVKDLNSLVSLYKKFQKNSAFFLFSFLLLFMLGMGIYISSIIAPGNPVAVAGEYTVKAVSQGAGKVAKVATAPVGKTIVTIIKTSVPEDTKSADPLGLTNMDKIAMVDDLGNLLIAGQLTAKAFSGSGEGLTNLPASEVIGELTLATLPWGSVTDRPLVLTISDTSLASATGAFTLAAGSGISLTPDDTLDTITITNVDLGSVQAIFKNISVAGQPTVVADSANDTLTFVAGANLVITADPTADSVTFSVTGTVANADTLDLLDSTQFLRSDASDSFTAGTLTLEAGTTLSVGGTVIHPSLSISSGSRVSNTTTFNPAAGGSQYGYNLSITNAPTAAANTAYGFYVSQSDTTTLNNTNYGVYSNVTHTGPTAGSTVTYGGYFRATGDTGGSSTALGVYGQSGGADVTYGVYGLAEDYGVYGVGEWGVYGRASGPSALSGVYGEGPVGVWGETTGASYVYGVFGYAFGAGKTGPVYAGYFENSSTSSVAGINKYGLYVTSTGTWNGAGSTNYGLYLTDTTGGTNNYPIYQAGTTGSNVFTANSTFGRTPAGNDTLYGVVIQGALCVDDSTANCPAAPTAGAIYVENSVGAGNVSAFDIAEYYPALEPTEKGDLVSAAGNSSVTKAAKAYDPGIIGIVSTDPAAVIDETSVTFGKTAGDKFNPMKPYVALTGRVPTKVSTENGPIAPGDPLTSSSTPGVAMSACAQGFGGSPEASGEGGKATHQCKSGPIIGKALESYDNPDPTAIGKIMVFVSVGWYVAPVGGDGGSGISDLEGVTSLNVENLISNIVDTQILFVGDRKISMAKNGSLKIEGDVEITGSLIAGKISTDEIVISGKSSGSATIQAGAKEVTIENALVKETSKILVTFSTDYSPATRYFVTKQVGKSFTVHLDQPVRMEAAFDWLILN